MINKIFAFIGFMTIALITIFTFATCIIANLIDDDR